MPFHKTIIAMIIVSFSSLGAPGWCCGFSSDAWFFFTFAQDETKQNNTGQHDIVMNLSGQQLQKLSNKAVLKYSSNIERLDLSCNKLVKLPALIAFLPKLKELDLSHNHFKDLPTCLGVCKKLEELNISFNQFKAIPTALSSLVCSEVFKTLTIDTALFDL